MVSLPFGSSVARRRRGARRHLGHDRARHIEPHHGAVADLGLDARMAARLLDEAIDHAQSEAGALAHVLGGEERLEGACQHVRRHPDAGVADRDHHVLPRLDLRRGLIGVEFGNSRFRSSAARRSASRRAR